MKFIIHSLIAISISSAGIAKNDNFKICILPDNAIASDCGTTFYLPNDKGSVLEYNQSLDYAVICLDHKIYRLTRIDEFTYTAEGIRVEADCKPLPSVVENGENPDNIEAVQYTGHMTIYFKGKQKTIKILAISGC